MAPVDNTPHVNTEPFELVTCLHSFNKVPIFEYKSKRTGLTVLIAETDGPVVNGFFCLATEAFDDDGLPHTLEHLIFLGSEDYPYKGVLDVLANRCFASGTNAWTDVDHTCYTMETVGSEGFLSLMPIYLDHILYPTLTDEGFITEVHHITGTGEDGGVVYCEMQGRENSGESRLHLNMSRAIYPGRCGYSSETGGMMKNLRESTTNEKVKNFHRQFYRPENLKVIIMGQVKHQDVFHALEPLEKKIISKGERGPFQRPWQSPVPPVLESKDLVIKYPADEEKNGIFAMAWRGPSAVNELYTMKGVKILLKYLTDFGTSPLPKEFVEIESPYASRVTHGFYENSISCIFFIFKDVPIEKLPEIKPKLEDLLKRIVDNEDISLERIRKTVKRCQSEILSSMEDNPQNTLVQMIIGYILYGSSKDDLQKRVNPIAYLEKLMCEPLSFWISLLKQYFIDSKYVALQCYPSKSEQKSLEEEEKQRIKGQKERLGEKGLDELAKRLERAVEFNEREPPPEMVTSVPIPSVQSFNFHNIIRYRSDLSNKSQIDLSIAPLYTCFDHIKSEFVYMYAFLNTSDISPDLRIYLPMYLESIFDCPIKTTEGQIISYEEVIDKLHEDTVNFKSCLGLGSGALFKVGPYSQTICIMIQVETGKYDLGVEWLQNILYKVVFDIERLKIIVTKMIQSASHVKRSGLVMVDYAMKNLLFVEDCNAIYNGVFKQSRFLTKVLESLNKGDAQTIVANLKKIQDILTQPKNVALHFLGNLDNIKQPMESLMKFLPEGFEPCQNKFEIIPDYKLIRPLESTPNGCIIGMGCLESSAFFQTTESIHNPEDPDLPALILFLQYVSQMEGPMWKQVRGKGYSYNCRILTRTNEGILYLIFNKATNVPGAYSETRNIIFEIIRDKQWDQNLIETAKSSLVFELIDQEKTIKNVVSLAVESYFQGVDYTFIRELIQRINNVTVEDLNRIGEKYVKRLLEPSKVKTAVVTMPAKVNELYEAFKCHNLELDTYQSLEDSFLNAD